MIYISELDQLHDLAVLTPVCTDGPQIRHGHVDEEKNFCPCWEPKPSRPRPEPVTLLNEFHS